MGLLEVTHLTRRISRPEERIVGDEYALELSTDDPIPDLVDLEALLRHVPGFPGRAQYPSGPAMEFRSDASRTGMPDLSVHCAGGTIHLCSYSHASTLREVIGTLAVHYSTEASDESIRIFRP